MTLCPFIQVLEVNVEAPPQVNIKLDLLCGCEAPTQTHKAHHQAPSSNTRGFSPNERANLVPTKIPTCLTPRPCENTCPKLQNINKISFNISKFTFICTTSCLNSSKKKFGKLHQSLCFIYNELELYLAFTAKI